ncbi:MAG: hypothetical protein WB608_23305 [Terracidiphilus sp.]
MMQETDVAPDDSLSLEARHGRLQTLVGELLRTNEELRLRVLHLEQKVERRTRSLDEACAVYGLLMP